jgi:hypothetical protein
MSGPAFVGRRTAGRRGGMAIFFVDCVIVGCNAAFDHEHFNITDCCAPAPGE